MKFEERSGPAMRDDHRIGPVSNATPMNEVHALTVHVGHELRLLVQTVFRSPPIKTVGPVLPQFAQACGGCALLPRLGRSRGCPPAVAQTPAQVVDLNIGHGNLKWLDMHGTSSGRVQSILDDLTGGVERPQLAGLGPTTKFRRRPICATQDCPTIVWSRANLDGRDNALTYRSAAVVDRH